MVIIWLSSIRCLGSFQWSFPESKYDHGIIYFSVNFKLAIEQNCSAEEQCTAKFQDCLRNYFKLLFPICFVEHLDLYKSFPLDV